MIVKHFNWVLFFIGILAATLRTIATFYIWSLPHSYLLNADAQNYHRYALILSGHIEGTIPKVFGLSPLAILWGGFWHTIFGASVYAVIIPQIVLGSLTAVLASLIAKRISNGNNNSAIIAGLITACCSPLLIFDCAILATSLAVFLSTLSIWFCLRAAQKTTKKRIILLGLSIGLSIACRPNFLLFVPVAAIIIFNILNTKLLTKIINVGLLLLVISLPVIPITVSNWIRGDVFIPVTHSAGVNLFIGNNQSATGRLKQTFKANNADELFAVFKKKAQAHQKTSLNYAEVSNFWIIQTGKEITDDPWKFTKLLGKKLLYIFNDFETPDSLSLEFLKTIVPFFTIPFLGFGIIMPFGILGLVILWNNKIVPGCRCLHFGCAISILVMLVFFVVARYRAPMLPLLSATAGFAITWLFEKLNQIKNNAHYPKLERKNIYQIAATLILLAALSTLSHLPILSEDFKPEVQRLLKKIKK